MLDEDLEEYKNTLYKIDKELEDKLWQLSVFYNDYYFIKTSKSLIDYNKCELRKRIVNYNNRINKLFYHRKQVCISIYDLFERNNLFKCKNYINNIDKYNDTVRIPNKVLLYYFNKIEAQLKTSRMNRSDRDILADKLKMYYVGNLYPNGKGSPIICHYKIKNKCHINSILNKAFVALEYAITNLLPDSKVDMLKRNLNRVKEQIL